MRQKSLLFSLLVLFTGGIIGWSLLFHPQAAPRHALDRMMPEGALLYIEAKDFSALLKDWTGSQEHAQWIKSDDYRVFSNSRLFLRLGQASDQFAGVAGIPPDMKFLEEAAGSESAVAVYDIGELEFLYIARLAPGAVLQSGLWQSRSKFQPRTVAGKQFFARKDEQSGRIVAFAVADDYLVLGTREDLVAGTLELMSGGKGRNLREEGWYAQALASASATPGDLRMVMNLKELAVTPHFRTYWIQRNITEMHGYTSAISDLYREGAVYREERVLIPSSPSDNDITGQTQAVSGLLALVPKEGGFYRVNAADARQALVLLQQKLLSPGFGPAETANAAPQVHLSGGVQGASSDLETRIDVEPASRTGGPKPEELLLHELERAGPQAALVVHASRKNSDGVLLSLPGVVAIAAARDWDAQALANAAQAILVPGLTASNMGMHWREPQGDRGYYELDGLNPIQMAVRGKLLFFSNDAVLLTSVLSSKAQPPSHPVTYSAGFNHARERANFYKLTAWLDQGARGTDSEPQFFSQNLAGFSRSMSRLASEEVTIRQTKDKIQQTVTYRWIP